MLVEEPNATLVDVRTMAEWTYVGTPDLSSIGKRPLLIEWQTFPDRDINPDFTATIARVILGTPSNSSSVAVRMPASDPNRTISAFLRFGPTPSM